MDEVQNPCNSECYTPPSEPRILFMKYHLPCKHLFLPRIKSSVSGFTYSVCFLCQYIQHCCSFVLEQFTVPEDMFLRHHTRIKPWAQCYIYLALWLEWSALMWSIDTKSRRFIFILRKNCDEPFIMNVDPRVGGAAIYIQQEKISWDSSQTSGSHQNDIREKQQYNSMPSLRKKLEHLMI
jgi:hypothetical protein